MEPLLLMQFQFSFDFSFSLEAEKVYIQFIQYSDVVVLKILVSSSFAVIFSLLWYLVSSGKWRELFLCILIPKHLPNLV